MKKIYLTLITLGFVGAINAQQVEQRGKMKTSHIHSQKGTVNSVAPVQMKATIWSSDFSTPSDWTIGNSSLNNADWLITNAPTYWWGDLASTSGGNQAVFDSDGFATAANQIENSGYIETPSMDCSTFPSVAVTFEQFFYKWTGRTFVEVSTDGGTTWTDFEVNAGMGNNDQTVNPSQATVDITSVAGSQADVKVRLLYLSNAISDGGTDHTAGDGWDYGWIVDDVVVGTLPDNDIALIKGWHGDVYTDFEYSMLPITQVKPMVPGVIIQNQGGLQQTVDVTCTISDGSGVVNTTVESGFVSAVGATDTIWFATGYTPGANDIYSVNFSIPADLEPSDDSYDASTLEVNPFIMAHDYGAEGGYGWNPAATDPSNAQASHSWGTIYSPTVDQDLYGANITLDNNTSTGLYLYVSVKQIDPNGVGEWIQDPLLDITGMDWTVAASDLGSETTIVFPSPVTLIGGNSYIIDVLKVDGTSGNEALYLAGSASMGEDDDFSTVGYGDYSATPGNPTYFSGWDFAPMIRANFDPSLSVTENTLEGISIYPNPSEGLIKITNANNTENEIAVYDITGKVITTKIVSNDTTIDLSSNGTGVYIVKVSNNSGSHVERVVIK